MASMAKATGRVLVQLGEDEPVEVGTIEIPIHASAVPTPARRERDEMTVTPTIQGRGA